VVGLSCWLYVVVVTWAANVLIAHEWRRGHKRVPGSWTNTCSWKKEPQPRRSAS